MNRTSEKFSYVARSEIEIDGQTIASGQQVGLTVEDAIGHITSGKLDLSETLARPPFELVEYAKSLLDDRDVVGPECTSPKALERAAELLLKDGKRNALVQGHEVRWGYQALERDVRLLVCGVNTYEDTVFHQVGRPYQKIQEGASTIRLDARVAISEAADRGLVFLRDAYKSTLDRRLPYEYAEVGAEWYAYREALTDLSGLASTFLQGCLEEGRVLVFDMFDNNAGLLSPARWKHEEFSPKNHPNIHFVFTRDLPQQWFNDGTGPRSREAMRNEKCALKRLEAQYAKSGNQQARLTKSDFVKAAESDFGLTKNRAEQVWKQAKIPNWKKSGRPKKVIKDL